MAVYLLAYDLIKERRGTHDYQPLWDELNRLGGHKAQYSTWLVALEMNPREAVNHFQNFIDHKDRIWATALSAGEYSYLNTLSGTKDWLDHNLSRR